MLSKFKDKIERIVLKGINVDRYLPIQLDITNACNLRCVHCYHPHHENEGAASLSTWKQILIQYQMLTDKMRYRPWVILCGGEPMTSPMLMPIIQHVTARMPGARISILTNGTLITEESIVKFKSVENLNFQVSLDGPDEEKHDAIRGAGNFRKALKGIAILQAHAIKFNVLSVLSKNSEVWMESFFKVAKEKQFPSINFVRFVAEGQGRSLTESNSDQPLRGDALKNAYQNLLRFSLKYQVKTKTNGPLFDLLIPGLARSGRFWESIVVDYQGYVVASSRAKLKLGHAVHDGIESIFLKHPIYKSLRSGKVEGCGTCSLYKVCGGDRNAAYADSGNFLGMDPGCWKESNQKELRRVL